MHVIAENSGHRPRHALLLGLLGAAALGWLLVALWAEWDYPSLQAVGTWPLGRVFDTPLFSGMLLVLLGVYSQNLVYMCSAIKGPKQSTPSAGSARPQWTHDIPLSLLLLAYLDLAWVLLGMPPLALSPDGRAVIGIVVFAALMVGAFLLCGGIVTRYGLASDATRPAL